MSQSLEAFDTSQPIAISLISSDASPEPYPKKKTDLVEGRNNMLRRKTHESCIKHF